MNCWAGVIAPLNLFAQFHADQVAQPSLSQMSFHCFSETLLPNHWCEISCDSVMRLIEPDGKWILVWTSST